MSGSLDHDTVDVQMVGQSLNAWLVEAVRDASRGAGSAWSRTVEASAVARVAAASVEQRGSTVVVDVPRQRWGLFRDGPSVTVTVNCPTGSSVDLTSESADLVVSGTVAEASLRSGSGSITLDTVTGAARLRTGSGDVDIDLLGGTLRTRTGSGNLTVRRAVSGAVRATGASGGISVGIEQGTAVWLDVSTVSGRVRQELGESDGPSEDQRRLEISAHNASGDLRVHRS